MSDGNYFAALEKHDFLNLETFRKNGEGVRTPVWFAADPATDIRSRGAKLYIYTIENTGKVKRVRWGLKFWRTPLFAGAAWSFGDSWATSVTPLTALALEIVRRINYFYFDVRRSALDVRRSILWLRPTGCAG